MQLKSLRAFVAVAEQHSFVGAAASLHTVQSNITAHIKKLEHELNAQLVERATPVQLTSAGQQLYAYAKTLLSTHDQAVAQFQDYSQPCGRLRIGAMETTAALRLPAVLSQYHARFAKVELSLHTGPTAELSQGLLAGVYDCVLVAGKIPAAHLEQHQVFAEELVLVSAQPLKTLPTAAQCLGTSFLAFRQGCSYRQRIEMLMARLGVPAVRIMEFGSLDALLGCVAAGMGYALLPKALVESQKARFAIHFLTLKEREIAWAPTYLVTAQAQGYSKALRAFVELLTQPAHCNVE